jgi:hypothetical protein
MLDLQAGVLGKDLLEWLPFMGGRVIQKNDEGTAQLSQQLTEEGTDFFLSDVVIEEQVVQTEMISPGAQRNSGNDRNLVAAALAMVLDRGHAPRRPSLDHQRSQQKTRFIGKN